jgi:tRNA pseudouridine38-40 synthase
MVRNIVGALVHVGKGAEPPQWAAALLASRDRTHGAATFAAEGLYLEAVEYDARWEIPRLREELALPIES